MATHSLKWLNSSGRHRSPVIGLRTPWPAMALKQYRHAHEPFREEGNSSMKQPCSSLKMVILRLNPQKAWLHPKKVVVDSKLYVPLLSEYSSIIPRLILACRRHFVLSFAISPSDVAVDHFQTARRRLEVPSLVVASGVQECGCLVRRHYHQIVV